MSEVDWLACIDPTPMIRLVVERPDDRKCRLLACAACRLVWDLLPDPRSRHAVEVAELFADGHASSKDLARARNEAVAAAGGAERQAAWAAYWATSTKASGPLWNAFAAAAGASARQAIGATAQDIAAAWDRRHAAGQARQAELLREVIGNPFRAARPAPALLRWGDGIIPALARGIYEDDAWDRMPILGDALEEAGCTDEALLAHCRGPGHHVRGCWAVDLLL